MNHRGVEQLVARLVHTQEVAGSSPAPATSFGVVLCPLGHEVDAGAYDHRRSCPRPTGSTLSKQPCDGRGLSAADGGEQTRTLLTARCIWGPRTLRALLPLPSTTTGARAGELLTQRAGTCSALSSRNRR